ncbi:DNA polymerase I [Candidatus Symbiothrix dinenymphae]|nr:DNA polymerase I [Candidatus Symbiothrix dinenymphae]
MNKLFLLDAYALIYRAYYALIKMPRVNSKGFNTSAVMGFVNTLQDVLTKEKPTHIGVAFDPSGPTFRHEVFAAYKAQREETPEVIRQSVPIIKDIIRAYNIPILEIPGFEADDVIGTLAKKAAADFQAKYQVFMMTPDKDYAQLVEPNIFIYKPKHIGNEFDIMGVPEVLLKYALTNPLQMIDYLGLMGDSSDNIPGCPGVGEVTAKKLIAQFGTIENLLAHTDQLKGALKDNVEKNREMIVFSKFLATIKTDVPINFNPEELLRKEINEPELRRLFEDLEFRQLSNRVFGDSGSKVKGQGSKGHSTLYPSPSIQLSLFDEPATGGETGYSRGTPRLYDDAPATGGETGYSRSAPRPYTSNLTTLHGVPHTYFLVDDEAKIADLIAKIEAQKFFAFDTETTGLDPLTAELVGMSFALQAGEAYFVPASAKWEEAQKTADFFKGVLENPGILKIGQNLKYDLNVMRKYGIRMDGPMFDTMLAHYLINPEFRHNLNYLAETYLQYQTIHIEELIGENGANQLNMRQVPVEALVDYAAEDADVALKLKYVLEKQLENVQLDSLFYDIEMPLMPVLADMEAVGVRVDGLALKDSSVLLTEHLRHIEEEIFSLVGHPFNVSSPKVVGEVLFDELKLVEKTKKTKGGGQYSTGEEVLEKLTDKHPAVSKILEFRKIKKLLSTYVDALPQLISPQDGKIHTTYNQATTSTGRLSSNNPNMQNIPVRDAEGREIRRAFIPDDGCVFLSADYSQIELRIMAHLSEDANMLEAFRDGQDIHAATAAKIYKVPINEVSKEMRRKAKTANFGIIYGISAFGLSTQLNIPRTEAKELIDGYFATFPGVKEYMDKSIAMAREKGYVETLLHRKSNLPDIHSANSVVRGYAERFAINAPIQGSAADIIKVAMVRIHKRFKEENIRSQMIMQVHDELNFNVLADELDIVKKIVVDEMEHAVELKVPLIAECGVGDNWLVAH